MSDALPMPGNTVTPGKITLKEGYTWEVCWRWQCVNKTIGLRAQLCQQPSR